MSESYRLIKEDDVEEHEVSLDKLEELCERLEIDYESLIQDPSAYVAKTGQLIVKTGIFYHKRDERWYDFPENRREDVD